MRKLTAANEIDVARLLGRFPPYLASRPIHFLGNAGGFSGATVARLECEAGPFCLRGWPRNSLPRARILGLHRLLRTLFERGLKEVAVPVEAVDGSTLVEDRGRFWQLEPWMPGDANFHQLPNPSRLRAAMSCLARWHNAAADFVPRDAEQAWFSSAHSAESPTVAERCERLREWRISGRERLRVQLAAAARSPYREIGEQLLMHADRAADEIFRLLDMARDRRFSLQPCLRDVWHDHVLFTGDDVTGLIDASAARTENVATDLARLIGSLVGDEREPRQQALDDYQAVRCLTAEELILFELLDKSGTLISGLNWLDWLFVRRRRFDQPELVTQRLTEIQKRLEYLAQAI